MKDQSGRENDDEPYLSGQAASLGHKLHDYHPYHEVVHQANVMLMVLAKLLQWTQCNQSIS